MRSILYITYDGLMEPLGQSQVLEYLSLLCSEYTIHIISFEKESDRKDSVGMGAMQSRLENLGMRWTRLGYHKRPSVFATAFDIVVGICVGLRIACQQRVAILHVRSYVPALIALPIKYFMGCKIIFDMRGFWADERVDGGLWPRGGRLYRLTKTLEDRFLRAADHIVTLTKASVRELENFPALRSLPKTVTVIPTCANLDLFKPPSPPRPPGLVLGYVGSIGTWYLFEETLSFFRALQRRHQNARLLIVNRNEHALINSLIAAYGIDDEFVDIVSARHDEVAGWIQKMHLGAALIQPSFSKIASAPTKLAEYLGCGVPCVGNTGVGDVADVLREHNVGVVIDEFSQDHIEQAVEAALLLLADADVSARCRQTACEIYSLERGVITYRKIYESLLHPQV